MRATYRIDGLTEARAALASVPEAVREVFAGYIRETAGNIEIRARDRAPQGPSGDLKRSIGTNIREDGLQATVGSGLYYSRFVELGTSRQRKKPFLYPAFRTSVRDFRKLAKQTEPRLRAKIKRGAILKKKKV